MKLCTEQCVYTILGYTQVPQYPMKGVSGPEWCDLLLGTPKYLTEVTQLHPVPYSGTFDTDANELDDTVPGVHVFVSNSYIYVHGDVYNV